MGHVEIDFKGVTYYIEVVGDNLYEVHNFELVDDNIAPDTEVVHNFMAEHPEYTAPTYIPVGDWKEIIRLANEKGFQS